MNDSRKIIINVILFQLGWFFCVLFQGNIWLPLAFTICVGIIHFSYISEHSLEWLFITAVAVTGIFVDAFFDVIGVLEFAQHRFTPIWLMCIWFLFATTLCHSLSWLCNLKWLAAILGAVAGPLSYIAGSRLSGDLVQFGEPFAVSVFVLAVFWGLFLPIVFFIADQFLPDETISGS